MKERRLSSRRFNPTLVRLRHKTSAAVISEGESFNPTLVRLRRSRRLCQVPLHVCFNPTLVRLRLERRRKWGSGSRWFQSHAGSIEAWEYYRQQSISRVRFNPTLVRLRLCKRATSGRALLSFNPTLVRLRQKLRRKMIG